MDKCWEKQKLLTQEEIYIVNRLITSDKIKLVIQKLPTKKPRPRYLDGLTTEFYQSFKKIINTHALQNITKKWR